MQLSREVGCEVRRDHSVFVTPSTKGEWIVVQQSRKEVKEGSVVSANGNSIGCVPRADRESAALRSVESRRSLIRRSSRAILLKSNAVPLLRDA